MSPLAVLFLAIGFNVSLRIYERYRGPIGGRLGPLEIRSDFVVAASSVAPAVITTDTSDWGKGIDWASPIPPRVAFGELAGGSLGEGIQAGWSNAIEPPPIRDRNLYDDAHAEPSLCHFAGARPDVLFVELPGLPSLAHEVLPPEILRLLRSSAVYDYWIRHRRTNSDLEWALAALCGRHLHPFL